MQSIIVVVLEQERGWHTLSVGIESKLASFGRGMGGGDSYRYIVRSQCPCVLPVEYIMNSVSKIIAVEYLRRRSRPLL